MDAVTNRLFLHAKKSKSRGCGLRSKEVGSQAEKRGWGSDSATLKMDTNVWLRRTLNAIHGQSPTSLRMPGYQPHSPPTQPAGPASLRRHGAQQRPRPLHVSARPGPRPHCRCRRGLRFGTAHSTRGSDGLTPSKASSFRLSRLLRSLEIWARGLI